MRLAAILVFTLGWWPIFRFRSEQLGARLTTVDVGERGWIVLTIALVTLHVCVVEIHLARAPAAALPAWRLALGIAVFAAGLTWWLWARRSLVPLGRQLDPGRLPETLVVAGPFAIVRHPLAFGMLVIALGAAIAAATGAAWLSLAAIAICLAQRCRQDEDGLRRAFGVAYERYAARTWRFVPLLW